MTSENFKKFRPDPILIHGTFIKIFDYGTLITGPSKIGKSTLALNLINRGHALIADDAPKFVLHNDQTILGECPSALQDKLAIQPIGIINIRQLFGNNAISSSKSLNFVVTLVNHKPDNDSEMSLLHGDFQTTSILGIKIPQLNIPISSSGNLPLLTETAIRHYFLNRENYER